MSELDDDQRKAKLIEIHGDGNCHICGNPKIGEGKGPCSYPHGRVPIKVVNSSHPEGFWEWDCTV